MPRNGQGVYSLPPVYEAVTGETIEAQQHNTPLEDIAADLNQPRSVATGGTGGASATQARDNLDVYSRDETDTAILENLSNAEAKTTPVDADAVVITDSDDEGKAKRVLWSRIKAVLKSYFDGFYPVLANNIQQFSNTSLNYVAWASAHVAFVKMTGNYEFYWRRNDTGTPSGANSVQLMSLNDDGALTLPQDTVTASTHVVTKRYSDARDAATLSSAQNYASSVGTSTLNSAKSYTDSVASGLQPSGSYVTTNTDQQTVGSRKVFSPSSGYGNIGANTVGAIEVRPASNDSSNDAFMSFHVPGDSRRYNFGLRPDTDFFQIGGGSMGAAAYQIWDARYVKRSNDANAILAGGASDYTAWTANAVLNAVNSRANAYASSATSNANANTNNVAVLKNKSGQTVGAGSAEGSGQTGLIVNLNSTGTALNFTDRGSARGSVTMTASGVSFNTSSDYRLKQDITPLVTFELTEEQFNSLDNSLLRVMAWEPVRHSWIAHPEIYTHGFIAHVLQQASPYAVAGERDAVEEIGTAVIENTVYDEDGKAIVTEVIRQDVTQTQYPDAKSWTKTGVRPAYQGVDPSKLVADLSAAVQSLTLMVIQQGEEIEALKGFQA